MIQKDLQTKIGIIGGGQLGKMMILEAKKMGFYVTVLDPAPLCPAHSICDEHIVGAFDDEGAIRALAEKSDVVTYEFEHIDAQILLMLEKEKVRIYPTAESLTVIQNKFTQKQALQKGGVPVPAFLPVDGIESIQKAAFQFGYPLILKTCTGGYDGKGNAVIKDQESIAKAYGILGSGKIPLMAERIVDFAMEVSVLACRGIDGKIVVYPVAENIHVDNVLHKTKVPASLPPAANQTALLLAERVMEIFKGVGMFCVEMFVTHNGEVSVNEVAPRPHNSGHYTIEGCCTSQFENHVRSITGLPLGDTVLLRPSVMVNVLGGDGYDGKAVVKGTQEALGVKGAALHIYGKEDTKPRRKMGHLTVTAQTLAEAEALADQAYGYIHIVSDEEAYL